VRKYVILFIVLALSSCGKEQVDNSTTHVVCEQYNYFDVLETDFENGEVVAARESSEGVVLTVALCQDVIDEGRDNDEIEPTTNIVYEN
jgi:hypothetical protein